MQYYLFVSSDAQLHRMQVYSSTPFDHNINSMVEVRERLQLIRNSTDAEMPLLITEFGSSYKTGLQNATTAT